MSYQGPIDQNPIAAKTFWRLVRDLSVDESPIAPVVRHTVMPGEVFDSAKISIMVYGNPYETLAVMAAAGISQVNQPMQQGKSLRLPAPNYLAELKGRAGFESNPNLRENFAPTWADNG